MNLLYFAWVRERVGRASETVEPPAEVTTVTALLDWLSGQSDGHAAAFAERGRLRAAVDQRFMPLAASLTGAREVAIFPPVTGG